MRVNIYTLGCKVNSYDSQAMSDSFAAGGYDIVEFDEKPDIYIINTCCVTALSEKKSRQIIRRAKRQSPGAVTAVVGCYPQTDRETLAGMQEVDIIAGTEDRADIVNIVERYIDEINESKTVSDTDENITDIMKIRNYTETKIENFNERTRAVIKIQDGCSNYCSYCIIPYTRGPVRSREPANIIKEAERIAGRGYKEIVLTGIHLSSFGRDIDNADLLDIIGKVSVIDGIERIRLGSLEPTLITEEFADELSGIEKICNHFHLSLQSGCNATLKRMNRKYTTGEYQKAVEILRSRIEDVSITTDIMTGFPGETQKEFDETVEFVNKIVFNKMHVFRFSTRKGTKAYDMKDQIRQSIKEERSRILLKLSDEFADRINREYIGKRKDVLFEQMSDMDGYIQGHTKNYTMVLAKGKKEFINKITGVTIHHVCSGYISGEITERD